MITNERPAAFMDAVLAIVMTRLVLELAHPATASIEGFLALKHEHFAYAVSLFWLGSMWVSITTERDAIERVDRHVLWRMIVLPFFSSPIPYATILVSEDFGSVICQSFYGIIVIALTLTNLRLGRAAEQANADIEKVDSPDAQAPASSCHRLPHEGHRLPDMHLRLAACDGDRSRRGSSLHHDRRPSPPARGRMMRATGKREP